MNLDYILKKETVLSKVFKSQLKNYQQYHTYNDFFIQTTLKEYNDKDNRYSTLSGCLNDASIKKNLFPIKKHFYSKVLNFKLYSIFYIPLLNDFTKKGIGYTVILGESTYLNHFFNSIIYSYLTAILLSLLILFILYKKKHFANETKEKEMYKQESYTDELTKCKNRKAYNESITKEISLSQRYDNITFSIILCDVDHFKSINDNYGHNIGDEVLMDMCKLINTSLRKNDCLYRIGGEEFIVILPHTKVEDAILTSQKLKDIIEDKLNIIEDKIITVSIGVTEFKDDDTEDSIFKRVDEYLYNSKNNGRNMITSNLNYSKNQ